MRAAYLLLVLTAAAMFMAAVASGQTLDATELAGGRRANHVRYLGLDLSTDPYNYIFDSWVNKTSGTYEKVIRDISTLMPEVERDLSVEGYFDVYQIYTSVFDFARRSEIADLTDAVLTERFGFKWLDVMLSARRWLTEVQGRVFSVPVDADPLVLYYRRDLISEAPTTWEELIETAQRFHGQDLNGDGVPDYGTCLITEGQFSMYAFTIANTVARASNSRREHYLFDANEDDALPMRSLITSKVYEHSFDILEQLYNVSQGWGLRSGFGPTQAFTTWKTGRCATFISFPSVGSTVAETPESPYYEGGQPCCTFMRGKQGVARTPGSSTIYVRETDTLERCDTGKCPNQEFGNVNRPTFMDGAVQLIINANTPVLEAALSFAAHFSANADVRLNGALNPYRNSHFNATWFQQLQPIPWVGEDARQFTTALFETMNAPTTASRLRMPGAALISARFEAAMKEAIAFGGLPSNRTTPAILAQLEADIFDGLLAEGLTRDALEDFFRTDVGLPPRKYPSDSDKEGGFTFPLWALVPIALVVGIAAAAFLLRNHMETAAAPKNPDEPVAIALVAIRGLTDMAGDDPALAQELQAKATKLVRAAASEAGAYHVKRIGDALVVAASSTDRAVAFGVHVLENLAELDLERIQARLDATVSLRTPARSAANSHRSGRTGSHRSSRRRHDNNADTRSQASSHRSSRSSRQSGLHGFTNNSNTGAPSKLQVAIGVHFALTQIHHDEERNVYDYVGGAVDGAAVCVDAAHGGEMVISENVRDNIDTMPAAARLFTRGVYALRGSGEQTLSVMYTDKTPVPDMSATDGANDASGGGGNTLAAIDQASGRLGRKRIAVAHVRLVRFDRLHQRETEAAFQRLAEDVHRRIVDTAIAHKGAVHAAISGAYTVTFNASGDCMLPFQKALRFASSLHDNLHHHNAYQVAVGVAVGSAYCGKFVPDDMTPAQCEIHAQHVVYGACLDQAAVLSGVAMQYPSFVCVTTAAQKGDADSLAVATLVNIVRIPHAPTPVGALGIVTLRGDGACDEWMYVLRGEGANAFAIADRGFTAVLERDAEQAKLALTDLAAATEVTPATATDEDAPATVTPTMTQAAAPNQVQRVICANLAARIAQLAQGKDAVPCAETSDATDVTCGFDGGVNGGGGGVAH